MNSINPTPVRIGMNGALAGKRYRVAGRVVMSMDDQGERYSWNEFNLVSDDGRSATLVYEATEQGGQWRLFTLFEPDRPLSAAEAAARRVGDRLKLDGLDAQVTLVDESRVDHIEGEAPEGVELGDVARYFNAEAGNKMYVVSWTGPEVEVYRGLTMPPQVVASAFGVSLESMDVGRSNKLGSRLSGPMASVSSAGAVMKIVAVVAVGIVGLATYSSRRPVSRRPVPAKIAAPASPLALGSEGTLDGKTYRLQAHVVIEIGQDGQIFDRHEYPLVDQDGNAALLVHGLSAANREWFLFTPMHPREPLTPLQAAALRIGQIVNVDGVVGPVTELFRSTILQKEGAEPAEATGGAVSYGFAARSASNLVLVRWNESSITFHRSKATPVSGVTNAFSRLLKN